MDENLLMMVWEDIENTNKTYFETGFEELDEIVKLREKRGALITIGARPAMGKTTFMLSILENLIIKNRKTLFFSIEMSTEVLLKRLLCQLSEVSLLTLKTNNLNAEDWEKLAEAMNVLKDSDLTIDDTPGISVEQIEEKIKEIKPEVVFIDYLQLIEGKRKHDRFAQIEDIMKNLKRIAKENGVVIFINSQLSRALESRCDKRPLLSDLRESGAIENISDIVIFLYREEYYKFDDDEIRVKGETEVIVAKNKFGLCGTVYMCFKANIPKFYSGRSSLNDIF